MSPSPSEKTIRYIAFLWWAEDNAIGWIYSDEQIAEMWKAYQVEEKKSI